MELEEYFKTVSPFRFLIPDEGVTDKMIMKRINKDMSKISALLFFQVFNAVTRFLIYLVLVL